MHSWCCSRMRTMCLVGTSRNCWLRSASTGLRCSATTGRDGVTGGEDDMDQDMGNIGLLNVGRVFDGFPRQNYFQIVHTFIPTQTDSSPHISTLVLPMDVNPHLTFLYSLPSTTSITLVGTCMGDGIWEQLPHGLTTTDSYGIPACAIPARKTSTGSVPVFISCS